jgi:hypothetical protein
LKNNQSKQAGDVARVVAFTKQAQDPEFKPQYCQNERRKGGGRGRRERKEKNNNKNSIEFSGNTVT